VDVQEPIQADDKLSLESFLFVRADVSDPAQAKHAITEAAQCKVASCGEGGSSEGFCGYSSSEFEWGVLHVTMCAAIHASGTIEYHSHFKHTGISK
jgi:hypothetical protein